MGEQAQKELLHAIFMNRLIPDDLGNGCREIFGAMNGYNIWSEKPASERDDVDEAEEERSAKRQKTDPGDADNTEPAADSTEPVEGDTKAAEEDAELVSKCRKGRNVAGRTRRRPDSRGRDGGPRRARFVGERPAKELRDEEEVWGASNMKEDWEIGPKVNTVHKLLGPTTLPLAHTTDVVERSTRRIKSVAPPAQPQQPKARQGQGQGQGWRSRACTSSRPRGNRAGARDETCEAHALCVACLCSEPYRRCAEAAYPP